MPEIIPDPSPLFAALASFVLNYAATESYLHELLCALTGMKPKIARIVLSGMRSADFAPRIRKLMPLSGIPIELMPRVESILSKFTSLNTLIEIRNAATDLKNMAVELMFIRFAIPGATESKVAIRFPSETFSNSWQYTRDGINNRGLNPPSTPL